MSHAKSQPSKANTWAKKVKVSDSSTRCSLEQLPRQPASSTLKIPRDMQLADEEIWSRCMVGFFVGYKMPFHAVNSIARRIWNPFGLEKVTTISNDFIMFRFSAESSIHEIMAKGPWLFRGKSIILHKWYPGFQFDRNKINALPVWVRLMGLPFPLWNKQEVDATVPYVHQFKVESHLSDEPITVEVIYEWKPSRCPKCKVFGHSCKEVKAPITEAPPQVHTPATNVIIQPPVVDKEHPALGENTSTTLLPNIFSADPNLNLDRTTTPNEPLQNSHEHDTTVIMHNQDPIAEDPIPTNHTKNTHTTKKGNLKGKTIALNDIVEEETSNEVGINTHKDISTYHCVESKMDSISTSMSDMAESSNSTGQPVHNASLVNLSPSARKREEKEEKGGSKPQMNVLPPSFYYMVGLGSWNIWGLNSARKQSAVRKWMHHHQLDIIGILETRVMPANISSVQAKFDPHWKFVSEATDTYCRIMVGWNTKAMDFHQVNSSSQWFTGEISNHATLTKWRNAKATFLPRLDSDHSAIVLNMAQRAKRGAAPFKFLNFWTAQDNFMDMVKEVWQAQIRGNPLFQLSESSTF
ncbi:hypothetical protein OIU85_013149 [Salix viminalis]|uniref:DUF4283 domain-containing protein n=1 Tax=Salix viminalis TaxID=40686 RepID=A0A9Q0SEU5_SALVM|nr:hypothetical protein OIU85_013149 [Salix viminalis]